MHVMVKAWTEFFTPLHLREVRKSGTTILLPALSGTHYVDLFAAGYLAATDKEPPTRSR